MFENTKMKPITEYVGIDRGCKTARMDVGAGDASQ